MNEISRSDVYADAGVDITAGYKAVELMKKHIARTLTSGVCSDVGGFGGLFELDLTGITKPVLVSGTDGVGTKLKLAFLMDKHDTVGIDCVAMCVNDIICCGAKPLFFLDYIACGKNVPERIADIVKGVCDGCVQAGAALIGGETAEMPGFYPVDEYDLAGYCTGIVRNRRKIVSVIENARHFLEVQREFGSFDRFLWAYVDGKPIVNSPETDADVPASTPLSDRISRDLKKRGFTFVGTTIVYSLLQSAGLVDDHLKGCGWHVSRRPPE